MNVYVEKKQSPAKSASVLDVVWPTLIPYIVLLAICTYLQINYYGHLGIPEHVTLLPLIVASLMVARTTLSNRDMRVKTAGAALWLVTLTIFTNIMYVNMVNPVAADNVYGWSVFAIRVVVSVLLSFAIYLVFSITNAAMESGYLENELDIEAIEKQISAITGFSTSVVREKILQRAIDEKISQADAARKWFDEIAVK